MTTLADKLIELTYHPLKQFGPMFGMRKSRGDYHAFERNMIELRMQLRSAKRFVLDDAFVKAAVFASKIPPEVAVKYSKTAHLPFPVIWLEYSLRARIAAQFELGSMAYTPDLEKYHGNAGFLLMRHAGVTEHPVWTATYVCEPEYEGAWIGPIRYCLRCTTTKSTAQTSKDLGAYSWGYAVKSPDNSTVALIIEKDLDGLCMVEPDPYFMVPFKAALQPQIMDIITTSVREGRGDMRWLVTVLTMINHVPIEYEHVAATGTRTVRLKTMPNLDYNTVKLVAGASRTIRLGDEHHEPSGIRRKQYEVRGFNRVLHRGLANEKTVWVREHKRGDPSLGVISHDYEVVK